MIAEVIWAACGGFAAGVGVVGFFARKIANEIWDRAYETGQECTRKILQALHNQELRDHAARLFVDGNPSVAAFGRALWRRHWGCAEDCQVEHTLEEAIERRYRMRDHG